MCVCVQEGNQYVKKIGGVFAFKVKDGPDGREATWIVNVRDGKGCVHNDTCEFHLCVCSRCNGSISDLDP